MTFDKPRIYCHAEGFVAYVVGRDGDEPPMMFHTGYCTSIGRAFNSLRWAISKSTRLLLDFDRSWPIARTGEKA